LIVGFLEGVRMNQKRREALRLTAVIGLMAATGLISQAEAATWNKAAFEAKHWMRY
jgi:sulfur-oxidizing protein SoxY